MTSPDTLEPTDPVDENAPPVAFGGSADAVEDTVLRGELPAADDPDGDPLVYAKRTDPANGRVSVATDGSFVYTPSADFSGVDSFDFSVSDGRGGVAVQTMSIFVEAVEDGPELVAPIPDLVAFAGQPLLFALPQGTFFDVDTETLDYSLERADGAPVPDWLFLDPLTLSLTGTPEATDAGRLDLKLIASDGSSLATDAFAVTVKVLPTVSIGPASIALSEGNAGTIRFAFTLTRSGDLAAASEVRWRVVSDQASGQDFSGGAMPGGTVVFAARQASATVTVDVVGDGLLEADEAFVVTLSEAIGAVLGSATASGRILNDEPLPYPTIGSIPDLSAAQIGAAAPLVLSRPLVPDPEVDVRAEVSGRALSSDPAKTFTFQALAGALYRITAVSQQDPASLSIHDRFGNALAVSDDFDDPVVPIGGISYASDRIDGWIAPYTGTFHLFADLRPGAYFDRYLVSVEADLGPIADLPTFSVTPAQARVPEGTSGPTVAAFLVSRSGGGAGSHVIDWQVIARDADARDFAGGALPSGRITLGDGEPSGRIEVQVAGDLTLEGDEAFDLRIVVPSGAPVEIPVATATIVNDDRLPVLSLEAVDTVREEGDEGATLFTFVVQRSGDPETVASVSWRVVGAAAEGFADAADFASGVLPSGRVELAAGQSAATIVVRVSGDTLREGDESFGLVLSDPVGGTLGKTDAIGTIREDDQPVGSIVIGTAGNDGGLLGGVGPDTINGLAGNDTLTGLAGDDLVDGGPGTDTAVFTGPLSGYTLLRTGATLTVTDLTTARDGTDTATNLERLQFADLGVNLTVQAAGASIPRQALDRICELYVGFFGRVPAADGLENWISQFKGGKTLDAIADDFYGIGSSAQLRAYTGYWDLVNDRELSNTEYVRIVYRNVLGREGLEGGLTYWADQLGTAPGQSSRGELVSTMLDAAHGLKTNADWGWVAALLDDRIAISRMVALDWGLNYAATAQQAIERGMEIAGAVTVSANPSFPAIPVKVFDFDAAVAIVGVDPAAIGLAP